MSHQNWTKVPIKELYSGFWDGPHATPKEADSGPIYLGIKNITEDGHLDFSDIRHIAEEDFPKWIKRTEPKPGDIVFSYEATLNRYAIIPEGFRGCLGRRLALIRTNPEAVETRFLYYYFFGEEWRKTVSKWKISGATVDRLPIINFPEFEVHIPPLPIQRKIADVLSAYDDLIEVNARRIRVLEAMAQSVYREWFGNVDAKSLPRGWEMVRVKSVIERLPKGTVYEQDDVAEKGEVIVIDQSRAEFLGFHNNAPDFDATPENPIAIFGDHTCKMQLLVRPFSIGPNVVPFTSTKGYPIHYVFSLVNGLVETKDYKRHWNDLVDKDIALPPVKLANQYAEKIQPILAQQDLLMKVNRHLRRTRDLLLPRLVSGEVGVEGL
ncbi:MAG: restriction endonuclease subunit S [Chloroflexi bacterium]|nr:restriction endonuclease subunit S [Chloroflexota bacterium]